MTETELTIKGDVEVLRLQPGDIIVITLEYPRLTPNIAATLKAQAEEQFPGHQIVVVSGLDLTVTRPEPIPA